MRMMHVPGMPLAQGSAHGFQPLPPPLQGRVVDVLHNKHYVSADKVPAQQFAFKTENGNDHEMTS